MAHVMNLDDPKACERAKLFKRIMPMAMENLTIAQC